MMRHVSRVMAFIAVILPLTVVNCGGNKPADNQVAHPSSTPQATPAPVPAPAIAAADPCALISADEVLTAAGIKADGTSSVSGQAKVCTWADAAGKSAVVQVFPTAAGFEAARSAFESFYKTTAEKIDGLGDEACRLAGTTASMPTATVCLRKGSASASAQVMQFGGDVSTLSGEAEALARVIAAKL